MSEKKNSLDFDEPADGGMIAADTDDVEEVDEEAEEVDDQVEEVEQEEEEEVDPNDKGGTATLPLDVIEEAIGYGLTSQEIESLGSEENISAVLAILDRQIDSASTKQSDSVFGDDDDPFAEPDENSGGSNSEIAELRKQIAELRSSLENKSSDANSDKLFGLLDNDYSELFGEVGDDLTKTQSRNRSKVLQELDTIKAGYKARKRAIPSDRRLFKQAVRSVFGDFESKVVKKKFSESAKKRKSQFISRVNSRDARRPKDGRSSAVDSVKKFLADRGYTDLESVETFERGNQWLLFRLTILLT